MLLLNVITNQFCLYLKNVSKFLIKRARDKRSYVNKIRSTIIFELCAVLLVLKFEQNCKPSYHTRISFHPLSLIWVFCRDGRTWLLLIDCVECFEKKKKNPSWPNWLLSHWSVSQALFTPKSAILEENNSDWSCNSVATFKSGEKSLTINFNN